MNVASWGPPGSALGGFLGRLEVIVGVFERSFVDSGPSWIVWTASGGGFGSFGGLRGRKDRPRGSREKPQKRPRAPESAREFGGLGPKETTILDLSGLHEPWGIPRRAKGTVADIWED